MRVLWWTLIGTALNAFDLEINVVFSSLPFPIIFPKSVRTLERITCCITANAGLYRYLWAIDAPKSTVCHLPCSRWLLPNPCIILINLNDNSAQSHGICNRHTMHETNQYLHRYCRFHIPLHYATVGFPQLVEYDKVSYVALFVLQARIKHIYFEQASLILLLNQTPSFSASYALVNYHDWQAFYTHLVETHSHWHSVCVLDLAMLYDSLTIIDIDMWQVHLEAGTKSLPCLS